MTKWILCVATLLLLFSCSNKNEKPVTPDDRFEVFCQSFIEDMLQQFPEWAVAVGRYEHADLLTIPTEARRAEDLAFYQRYLDSLDRFNPDSLSDLNRVDWILIQNQLAASKWYVTEFRSHEWNPSSYNVAGSFDLILTGSFAPLTERLEIMSKKLPSVPAYYVAARSNILNPTPEHTRLAADQNAETGKVFRNMIDSAVLAGWSGDKLSGLQTLADQADSAAVQYARWLENDVLPKATRSFRMGSELYEKKFASDLMASASADEMYQRAIEEMDEIHTEMLRLTQTLWPTYFNDKPGEYNLASVKKLIDEISTQHVHRDSFLVAIEEQLEDLVAFVKEEDLLTLDDDKPLVVRPTPEYARGVAGAGIDAPGPFEQQRNTYYNVTPLDAYSPEKAESWLREYNYYILQILNIHEAIPGHYTQLVYSNKSKSLIKSLFGNGAMVEGWACYVERMMLEEGYGKNVDEMWLMYYKWRLREICNFLLDVGVHTQNMSKVDAIDLLVNKAFQQEAEAAGKWKRVQYTAVQLCSYYVGSVEILDLRSESMNRDGADFNLKAWHEHFLSYGSAPVKLIRELMLTEKTTIE